MPLRTTDLKPSIGARVDIDRGELLAGTHAAEIMALLDQRSVLVFPGIGFDDEEQLAFARTLGKLTAAPAGGRQNIGLDQSEQSTRETVLGTFFWHMDGVVDAMPPRATILSPRRLSDRGGQTEYCNLYAAYEALDADTKHKLEGLRAIHDREAIHRLNFPDPTDDQLRRWRSLPPRSHPIVWAHASGRKSLMLGTAASLIEGMDEDEARGLLAQLQDWASQPQFTYRHEWQMGDLLMWDNCGALHRVIPYDLDSDRLMFRVTLQGQEQPQ